MLKEEKYLLWRVSSVCLGIALPMLFVGRAYMFILLALGVIAGLFATRGESLRATVRLMLQTPLLALLIVLLAVWFVGVWGGIAPAVSLAKWNEMAGLLLIAGLLFVTLREMPGQHLDFLMQVLVVALVGMCGLALVDAVLGWSTLGALLHGQDEAETPYRLNYFSPILAVLSPFVWGWLLTRGQEEAGWVRTWGIWIVGLALVTVVVCGGRSGWVGLLVSGLVFLALAGRYHHTILHARHYGLLVVALVLGGGLYTLSHGWGFVEARLNPSVEAEMGRGVMSGRLDVWMRAWEHIGDKPLFGIGLNAYRLLPDAIDLHPHNWFLQIVLETGFVGAALFVLLLVMIGKTFHGFARGNLYGASACASFVAFWVSGLANTSIFNVWWAVLFVMTTLLGWRAGWSGAGAKALRKGRILKRQDLVPFFKK